MATPPTPPKLSERDVSYLKLLKTLKQSPTVTEGALGVVRRIAAWIDSVAVLNFIATHQPWLDDWEVKEALVHNDRTPHRVRAEIEKAIAIFDLLREMDAPDLSAKDKAEIQEDIKYLFKTLLEHDRAVVKKQAYSLSASRQGKTGPGVGLPETPAPATAAAPPPGELQAAPATPAAPAEPSFGAEAVDAAAAAALAAFDGTESTTDILRQVESEALSAADEAAALLATQEEEPAAAAEEAEVAEAPSAEELAAGQGLAAITRDQKVAAARTSPDLQLLGVLVYDADEAVHLALLENPALTDRLASLVARRASQRVAAEIYRKRALFMRPLVQDALLECPNAPSAALLEVVNGVSDINELLKILRNPKIKFLEVKAKSRARLSMIFKSLGQNEKMAALRRAGSFLLKELWTDFFRDEALVVRCVQEKQVDTNIVLEIARSKIAPRRALEVIGTTPQYVANYQVCLELVLNPKTPRQVVTQLIHKLSPADRRMIKNNPAVPEAIRRFA